MSLRAPRRRGVGKIRAALRDRVGLPPAQGPAILGLECRVRGRLLSPLRRREEHVLHRIVDEERARSSGEQAWGVERHRGIRLVAGETRLQRVSDLVQHLDLLVLLVELHDLGRQRGPGLGESLLEGFVLRDLGGELLGAVGNQGLHLCRAAEPAPQDEPRQAREEQASSEDCP